MKDGRIFNMPFIALSAWGGYRMFSSESMSKFNSDWIAFVAILILTPLMVLIGAAQAEYPLRLPSWTRFSASFNHDYLQVLWLSTLSFAGMLAGGALRQPWTTPAGFWTLAAIGAFMVGSLVGKVLIHLVYRERIVKA